MEIEALDLDDALGDLILADPHDERDTIIEGKVKLLGRLRVV